MGYNADEARDDHGRFAGGGNGTPDTHASEVLSLKDAVAAETAVQVAARDAAEQKAKDDFNRNDYARWQAANPGGGKGSTGAAHTGAAAPILNLK